MICGWATQLLESKKKWSPVQAYRVVFFGYAILGLVKLGSTLALSSACEKEGKKSVRQSDTMEAADNQEDSPLLSKNIESQEPKASNRLGFNVTKDSLVVLAKVCFLQSLEAIAIGLMVTLAASYTTIYRTITDSSPGKDPGSLSSLTRNSAFRRDHLAYYFSSII